MAFRDDVRDGVRVRDDVSDAVIDLDIVGVRDGVRDGVMDRDVDRVSVGERDAVRDDVTVGPPVCDGGTVPDGDTARDDVTVDVSEAAPERDADDVGVAAGEDVAAGVLADDNDDVGDAVNVADGVRLCVRERVGVIAADREEVYEAEVVTDDDWDADADAEGDAVAVVVETAVAETEDDDERDNAGVDVPLRVGLRVGLRVIDDVRVDVPDVLALPDALADADAVEVSDVVAARVRLLVVAAVPVRVALRGVTDAVVVDEPVDAVDDDNVAEAVFVAVAVTVADELGPTNAVPFTHVLS